MGVTLPLFQFAIGASSAAGIWFLLAQQQLTQRSHKLTASIHELTQSLEAETRPPARIPTVPSIGERVKSRWNQSIEYGMDKAYKTDYTALVADLWKEGQALSQRLTGAAVQQGKTQ